MRSAQRDDVVHRPATHLFASVLLFLAFALLLSVPVSALRVGPASFDWFIKDAPPQGPATFKLAATGYWIAAEEDWPAWSTGEDYHNYGGTACKVPISKRGFYEDVLCEGSGITADSKVVNYQGISAVRSESKSVDINDWRKSKNDLPPTRPRRTIAVNDDKGTTCYIPKYSRVYLKFPEPDSPYTGWYIAEDTGGGFGGKCKVDIFLGIGKQDPLGTPSPTHNKEDGSNWPEAWVFPGTKDDYLWTDSIVTYLQGMPTIGLAPGAAGISAGEEQGLSGVLPEHPYFNVPYSIDPSFSVSAPFDFSIYDDMPGYMKRLERCKDDISCITAEVSAIESESKGTDWLVKYAGNVISKSAAGASELPLWEAYCEPSEKNSVSSLAEAIDAVRASGDSDCVAYYDIPVIDKSFFADPANSLRLVQAMSVIDLLGLVDIGFDYMSSDSNWEERVISFSKVGDGISISAGSSSDIVNGARFGYVEGAFVGDSPNKLRYTSEDISKKVYIRKDETGNISILSDDPALEECVVHNKIVKFCVLQNSSVIAYDASTNRLGMQSLAMKFAYLFKSEVTEVTGFMAQDAKYAANTTLLMWDELEGVDINFYRIYLSENTAWKATLPGVAPSSEIVTEALGGDLRSVVIPIDSRVEVVSLDLAQEPVCDVGSRDSRTCDVEYTIDSLTEPDGVPYSFKKDTLYYSQRDKKYFYFLSGISDLQRYFFAVTATDVNGMESPAFTMLDDAVYDVAENDVPPGLADVISVSVSDPDVKIIISPLDYAVEGSELDPAVVKHYRIFCSGSPSDMDLASAPSFFESGVKSLEDGSFEITASLADFNTANCGVPALPADVHIVIVGIMQDGPSEIYYKGRVTPMSFSQNFTVSAPTS